LADVIVRQMSSNKNREISEALTDISQYLKNPVLNRSGLNPVPKSSDHAAPTAGTFPESQPSPMLESAEDRPENPSWTTPEEFVEAIYPHALKVARRLGVEPEAIVAQAVLETGWGKHVMTGQDESNKPQKEDCQTSANALLQSHEAILPRKKCTCKTAAAK